MGQIYLPPNEAHDAVVSDLMGEKEISMEEDGKVDRVKYVTNLTMPICLFIFGRYLNFSMGLDIESVLIGK